MAGRILLSVHISCTKMHSEHPALAEEKDTGTESFITKETVENSATKPRAGGSWLEKGTLQVRSSREGYC